MNRQTAGRLIAAGMISILLAIASQDVSAQQVPTLAYGWQPNQPYGYQFRAEVDVDGNTRTSQGYVTYRLEETDVERDFSGESLQSILEGEATSTAFAITDDGYLLTCQHCIDGAAEIKIVVGDRELVATVIDSDEDLDLAIIKIAATGLKTVPLAERRNVQLAQDVRAIGYPLSDVLGSSVKVTRGSVAGFVELENHQNIQVDVAVNFGNSGGPLLDDTGAVVGVVNAKLSGQRIAKVGFAVPIRYACEMLRRNGIRFDSNVSTEVVSGVEVAKRVTPAVLFVKAQMGRNQKHARNFRISAKGSFKSTGGKRSDELEVVQAEAIVAKDGETIDTKEDVDLTMMLGAVASLPIEKLPSRPTQKWSDETGAIISLPKSMPPRENAGLLDGFNPGFGRRGFAPPVIPRPMMPGFPGGFGARPRGKQEIPMRLATAVSKTNYVIRRVNDAMITINFQHEMRTINDDKEFARLQIDRKGTLTFDRKQGVFVSKKSAGTLLLRLGKENLKFPTRLTYQQTDLETYIGVDVVANQPVVKPAIDSDQQLKLFLTTPLSDAASIADTIKHLAECDVDAEKSSLVTRKLVSMLRQRSPGVSRLLLIDALLNWDPTAATPFVINEFKSAKVFSARTWVLRLGRTGDPRAAQLLCKTIGNSRLRAVALVSLESMGSVAEKPAVESLELATDAQMKTALLTLLAKIGTQETIDKLVVLKNRDGWPLVATERTIAAIQQRLN